MARRSSRSFTVLLAFLVLAAAGPLAVCRREAVEAVNPPAPAPGGSLVSSVRSEPPTFNRYADQNSVVETITFLLHSRLLRINRQTMEVEPMLAESWTPSKDNLTYTVKLRRGVKWSDGAPFSSDDVLFSFRAIYQKAKDNTYESPIGDSMQVAGKPLVVSRVDDTTVAIRFPLPYGPGLRILDNLPIYPRHLLEQSLDDGTLQKAWGVATPPGKIAGLGPFVLKEYQSGQRLVFERNPNYWRRDGAGQRLPYLDRITLEIVQDQNAEILRMQSGQLDCLRSEIRADDYATLKQAASAGKVRLYDLGPGLDGDALWFNLRADAKIPESKRGWLQHVELRRAISEAVDRTHFVNTVFFGAAVPAVGAVSPANRTWFDGQVPGPTFDRPRAAARLSAIGLKRKNTDGILLDSAGSPVQFTLLTQKGNTSLERGAAVLRDDLRAIGIAVDVVPLQRGALTTRLESGDFEAVYFRFTNSDVDPTSSMDLWRSSGGMHVWNMHQPQPATDWERRIDDLMARQMSTVDLAARRRMFGDVQRILADQLPLLYFAWPRVFVATSARVSNATPVLLSPMVLWSADTVAVLPRPGTD